MKSIYEARDDVAECVAEYGVAAGFMSQYRRFPGLAEEDAREAATMEAAERSRVAAGQQHDWSARLPSPPVRRPSPGVPLPQAPLPLRAPAVPRISHDEWLRRVAAALATPV